MNEIYKTKILLQYAYFTFAYTKHFDFMHLCINNIYKKYANVYGPDMYVNTRERAWAIYKAVGAPRDPLQ
jgi:hypothetical protein